MASSFGANTISQYVCFSNGSIKAPPYEETIQLFGVADVPVKHLETKLRHEL